jgi:peptidyl-prolyl cis-trans isomerase C
MPKLEMGVAGLAALALACVIGAQAAAQQSGAPATSPAPAPSAPAGPDPAKVTVATVDGEAITLAELLAAKSQLPQQYRDAPLEMLYAQLLDQVVERRVIARAAAASGVADQPEVKAKLAQARENVLLESYITREVGPQMTMERLRQRYQSEVVEKGGEEEVRASHILVGEESDAKTIRSQIDGGADFTELAKKHSTGPSADKGGDLGFFRRQDMVPEFSEAAFALRAGEVSGPVKTQFGWHIIKVEERRTSEPPPFEQVADNLQRELARDIVTSLVADLRSKAEVKMFNADGSPMVMPNVIRPVQ